MSTRRKLLIGLAVAAIAIAAFAAWVIHGNPAQHTLDELSGKDPLLVEAQVESIPSVRLAKPVGWGANEAPVPAAGLVVNRFAEGLDHPRVLLTLPNGDVLVAEADAPKGNLGSGAMALAAKVLMKGAGAQGGSPDAIVLLRDANGDGIAEERHVLRQGNGLASPSGMAWHDGTLYVANHDAVLSFPYQLGDTSLKGEPKKLMDLPPAGNHWMRNMVLSADGKELFIAVGSASNIGERGMEIETGRAAIWQLDLATLRPRQYAAGMRNPNGMDFNPSTGELWAVVNERDQLGPDLPPDYLTNVPVGAHYGWPWIYWKTLTDYRVAAPPPVFIDDYVRKPEFGLGTHVAPLGLAFVKGGERMGKQFANGAFIARHGSWNRIPLTGYDVVFVKFDANGNPLDKPVEVLSGFLTGKGSTHGRPTWLAFDKGGALLVSDDTSGIIWRAFAPNAEPAAAIKPVVTRRLEPVKVLKGNPVSGAAASFDQGPTAIKQ